MIKINMYFLYRLEKVDHTRAILLSHELDCTSNVLDQSVIDGLIQLNSLIDKFKAKEKIPNENN